MLRDGARKPRPVRPEQLHDEVEKLKVQMADREQDLADAKEAMAAHLTRIVADKNAGISSLSAQKAALAATNL